MSHALTPLSDRVIATREETSSRTASGLYLPDSAKEKAIVAVIEAVGPDVKSLKKGDRVVYKEYSTTEIKVDNTEYIILKEEDVLAKVGK
ncbi:MAG: co-chaperone GroES [Candidatus Saccharimonadales bacterium]